MEKVVRLTILIDFDNLIKFYLCILRISSLSGHLSLLHSWFGRNSIRNLIFWSNSIFHFVFVYHLHVIQKCGIHVQHFYLKLIISIRFTQFIWHDIRYISCLYYYECSRPIYSYHCVTWLCDIYTHEYVCMCVCGCVYFHHFSYMCVIRIH